MTALKYTLHELNKDSLKIKNDPHEATQLASMKSKFYDSFENTFIRWLTF